MTDRGTTIRQRLDLAHHVLSPNEDRGYRRALSTHYLATIVHKYLFDLTKVKWPGYTTQILSSIMVLYWSENAATGKVASVGGPTGVSAYFLRFMLPRLPDGPGGAALRAVCIKALEIWQVRNPGVVAEPSEFARAANQFV